MLKQKIEFISNEIGKLNDVTKAMESYIKLKNDSTSVLLKPHINNLSSVACSVMPVLKEIDDIIVEMYENNDRITDLVDEVDLIASSFKSFGVIVSTCSIDPASLSNASPLIFLQLEKFNQISDMIRKYNEKNIDMVKAGKKK